MVALATQTLAADLAHIPLSEFALRAHVTEHQVRKGLARGVISPPKFGRYTAFPADQIAAYRKALEDAGIVRPLADRANSVPSAVSS